MDNIQTLASQAVEAIRRASQSLPDDVRALVFAEIARQLAPEAAAKKRKALRPERNALGKPISHGYDPNYKMKHRVSTAHLFKRYSDSFREHLTK